MIVGQVEEERRSLSAFQYPVPVPYFHTKTPSPLAGDATQVQKLLTRVAADPNHDLKRLAAIAVGFVMLRCAFISLILLFL